MLIVVVVLLAVSGGSAKPGSSVSAAPSGPGGRTPTGSQLGKLLPGNSELPKGWVISPASVTNTGPNLLVRPSAQKVPGLPCGKLPEQPVNALLRDYQVALATENARAGEVDTRDITLAGFRPGDTQKQMSEIRNRYAGCPRFSGENAGGETGAYTASVKPVPVNGADEAIAITVSSSEVTDGTCMLLAQFGNTIVGIDDSGGCVNGVPGEPSQSSVTAPFASLAGRIGQRVRSQIR